MLAMNMPATLNLVPEKPNAKPAEVATGNIYETKNFQDGVFFVDEFTQKNKGKTVSAMVDLDNTFLTYEQHTFGTDHWFDDAFKKLLAQGITPDETKKILLDLYLEIVRSIPLDDVHLVEKETPAVLMGLQARGVDVMALTSRGSFILKETLAHLEKCGVSFNKGTHANKHKELPIGEEGLMTQGVILTGGKHKGQCMLSALDDLSDLIVMWDDKLENLERVRASIAEYNARKKQLSPDFVPVQFIGIRYSRLDHKIKNVDRRVVELQETYFRRHKILSDKHVHAILKFDEKQGRKHYIGVDYQPQSDLVVLVDNKAKTLQQLIALDKQLEEREIRGAIIKVGTKEKVARQFKYTIAEFAALYPALKQAELIAPAQVAVFDVFFSQPQPTLTPMRDAQMPGATDSSVPTTGFANLIIKEGRVTNGM